MTSYIQDIVSNTGEPAYSVNDSGLISEWNDAAADAFGYSRREAVGEDCWKILRGRDVFGNQYCGPRCPHRQMAADRMPIRRCRMRFHCADDVYGEFTVSNLVLHQPNGRFEMLHLCRPEDVPIPQDRKVGGGPASAMLTQREKEVLAELAEGHTTRQIAAVLKISTATVRNHIDHILAKLNCHSRLQAVAEARKLHLT